MEHPTSRTWTRLVTLLGLYLVVAPVSAFTTSYCSTQNTASDTASFWWEWQTNGKCTDHCNSAGTYAFAVIQWQDCWCTDYIPQEQQDTSDCNVHCPGFDSEQCGDKDKGYYIYVKLAGSPSGTQGTSQPTSANVSPTPSSASSSSTATTLKTTTSSTESTSSSAAQTSVQVVTESGRVVTQTVVTTPSNAPLQTSHQDGNSSNTGVIVGGVVGGVAGVAALVGGIFFALWRRRRQHSSEDDAPSSGVQRNVSTLSKAGLLRTEKEPQFPPPIATNFNRRHSRTLDQESISPISGSDRRNSQLRVDQRLNPSAIFVFDNSSRGSFASMEDSRDYHRPLNIRNPDVD